MNNEQIQYLPIDKIKAEPQVRETFSEETIRGLAESMKELDQLQPIRVRKNGDWFVIVDGARRYYAAKLIAGRQRIAAIVEADGVGEAETLHKQLVANCQREDLSPLEKAR
ncbi:MAG: ParB/RepB/Spo0J family partition protein, partial [Planctomycetaceae bacterium]